MNRRKFFSLIPAGLIAALAPSFLKKYFEGDKLFPFKIWLYNGKAANSYKLPRNFYVAEKDWKDKVQGNWELCSIPKGPSSIVYNISDMRFATTAKGWDWD